MHQTQHPQEAAGSSAAEVVNADRELLELAAKAAGIEGAWGGVEYVGPDEVDCTDIFFLADDTGVWAPLTDDGDALRLAVKLRIECSPRAVTVAAHHWRGSGSIDHKTYSQEHYSDSDPYAATRRAIVRAAAAIGAQL